MTSGSLRLGVEEEAASEQAATGSAAPKMKMPHVPQLDGLRASAIIIVFIAHCGLERIIPGGFGVTIFFVLSGYLITSLLRSEYTNTGRISLSKFYWRRTLRIWPPLYITLALSIILMLIMFPKDHLDPWGIAAQLAFVSNYSYLWGHGSGVDLPLWSLAVEEHFYLIFPLIFLVGLSKIKPSSASKVCWTLCGMVLCVRVVYAYIFGPSPMIYYWSHTRIDSILFGCCLALYNNPVLDAEAWHPKAVAFLTSMIVLLLCFIIRDPFFRQTIRYTLQGCALYIVFSYVLHDRGRLARVFSAYPMRMLGLYSYTFYLAHVIIIKVCVEKLGIGSLVPLIVVSGTLTLLYCALMYRFVEAPLARRRRQLHVVDAQATLG
jgi:peptidoglycan/LPS O-acetylase OafA/YrhL